jgi:hypothetical protein
MNILKQYETINQEIKNYSSNNFANLIVVTKGRSFEDIKKITNQDDQLIEVGDDFGFSGGFS